MAKGLLLLNPFGVPTHDTGAILDLCFTRLGPKLFCKVHQDLDCGPDHQSILSQISDEEPKASAQGRLLYSACNWSTYSKFPKDLLVNPSLTNPDDEAKLLADPLPGALKAA